MGCQCSRRSSRAKVLDNGAVDGTDDFKAAVPNGDQDKGDATDMQAKRPCELSQERVEDDAVQPPSPPQTPPTPSSAPRSPLAGFTITLRRPSLVSNGSKNSKTSKNSASQYQISRQVSVEKVEEGDEESDLEAQKDEAMGSGGDEAPHTPHSPQRLTVDRASKGRASKSRSREQTPSTAEGMRSHSKLSSCSSSSHTSNRWPQDRRGGQPNEQVCNSKPPDSQDAIAELLGKAVLHSGSLVQQTLRVRALQAHTTLAEAYQGFPKPDQHMPNFDMKVDPENMLLQLPHDIFKPNQLALQRVSFMGTKWIALRLCQGSRARCLKFCLCAAALQNIGKNTSRSVVVEAQAVAEEKESIPGFVCSSIPTRDNLAVSWLDIWEEISELADIITNESCLPEKKVQADLKKWALKRRQKPNVQTKLRWSLFSGTAGKAEEAKPGRSRSRSDVGLSSPAADDTRRTSRRRSSYPDINVAVQQMPEEPQGAFSSMAKWFRNRISLRGVFTSLEDQLASLTPPPPTSSPSRGRSLRQPAGAGGDRARSRSRSRSRDRSKDRSGSKSSVGSGRPRRRSGPQDGDPNPSSCSSSDNEDAAEGSSHQRRRPSEVNTDGQDPAEVEEPLSPARRTSRQATEQEPCSPGSRRRKSVSGMMLMPVVPEIAVDGVADEAGPEEDETPFRRHSTGELGTLAAA